MRSVGALVVEVVAVDCAADRVSMEAVDEMEGFREEETVVEGRDAPATDTRLGGAEEVAEALEVVEDGREGGREGGVGDTAADAFPAAERRD